MLQTLWSQFGPVLSFRIEFVNIVWGVYILIKASNQIDFLFSSDEGMFRPWTRVYAVLSFDLNPVKLWLIVVEIDWVKICKGPVKNLVASVNVEPKWKEKYFPLKAQEAL